MLRKALLRFLIRTLLHPAPKITISQAEEKQFQLLFERINNDNNRSTKEITYDLTIPKYKFFYYLSQQSFIFHGSNEQEINEFQPRKQTLANGKQVQAIFATKDPIWSLFYATLNKQKIVGSIRNGSLSVDDKRSYHYYSLTKETINNNPWTSGTIYIFNDQDFTYVGEGSVQFNEWICHYPITPLAKINVEPSDFYFLHKIAIHHSDESNVKTWLLYKLRTLFNKSTSSR